MGPGHELGALLDFPGNHWRAHQRADDREGDGEPILEDEDGEVVPRGEGRLYGTGIQTPKSITGRY